MATDMDQTAEQLQSLHVSETPTAWKDPGEKPMEPMAALPEVELLSRFAPGGFATVSLDESQVACVTGEYWFYYPNLLGWEDKVLEMLHRLSIVDVYCTGPYHGLKQRAPQHMQVHLNVETQRLKYPCNYCGLKCAITKAFLTFRKIAKRERCNLAHVPNRIAILSKKDGIVL